MHMSLFRVAAAVPLVAALVAFSPPQPSAASGSEWPRWRGANFDGTVTTGKNIFAKPFALKVRWRKTIGTGYSGVVIADGHAVTMASDGKTDFVIALSSDSGAEKWRVPVGEAFPGRDGSTGGPVSTPAIASGVVYALGPHGNLVALRLASGAELWKRKIEAEVPHWGFTTSPLIAGDVVIVLTGGAPDRAITAFNKQTGAVVWSVGSDVASYQSPMLTTVDGRELVLVGGDQYLFALDPANGREVWRYEHGGRGFYAKIVNPVRVARDEFLITYRPDESVLLKTAPRPEVAWSTRELKLNYATPVVSGGRIFGYSGAFLTAIDARTGTLAWRSRPPGDGFPILVDGHLVVLTKRGTLAVAATDSAAYDEKASIELFTRLAWTPPSFAEGRIFARDSYAEIAAVDVVPLASKTMTSAADPVVGRVPGSRFDQWVTEVERASDAEARINKLLADQKENPILEGDRIAHLVYKGVADDLALRGDLFELGREVQMHRVGKTDFFFASLELPPDARIAYQFVRNLGETIADPRNPRQATSPTYAGSISLLVMPGAEKTGSVPGAATLGGRMEEHEIETATEQAEHLRWGGKRKVFVYLPRGYEADQSRRYPVLYVLYGEEMKNAHFDAVLDHEIGATARPLIAVFVESTNAYEYARTFREAHRRMLTETIVKWTDSRFRTLAEAQHRFVLGHDEAGVGALETVLNAPQVFGGAALQSIFPVGKGDEELLALIDRTPKSSQRFYVDWGKLDPRRRADNVDVAAFTSAVRDRLRQRGFQVESRETPDGSALPFFADRGRFALRALFPQESR